MAGTDSEANLDVARSELAGELRDSVGFDAETAAGVVEALFSGSMDAEAVVEGLLGGDPRAAAAVSRFCSEVSRQRGGGGSGGASSGGGGENAAGASSSSSASTYQPASLSAEAAAARAREEASRSAAAAVAAVSTGALAAVPAGARAGRALVFKEAKPQAAEKETTEAEKASGSGGNNKQALGDKKILPADRDHANCLFCGRVYSTRSADAETRRLLETGRCVFGGCGARVALRAGEVSDVRPAGRRGTSPSEGEGEGAPSSSARSSQLSEAAASAAAFVDDLARNPWLSSSERAAAIASARDAERAAAASGAAGAAGPVEEEETEEGVALGPAPGLSSSSPRLLFSLPPRRRRHHDFGGKAGGSSYSFEEGEEEKKQAIPGYYAPDEERSRAKGKGKKRGG